VSESGVWFQRETRRDKKKLKKFSNKKNQNTTKKIRDFFPFEAHALGKERLIMQQQQPYYTNQPPPPSFAPHGGGGGGGGENGNNVAQQQQQQQQPSLFVPPPSSGGGGVNQNQASSSSSFPPPQMQFMPSTFAPPSSSSHRDQQQEQQQQQQRQRNSIDGGSGRYQPPPPSQNFQSQASFQNRPEPTSGPGGWAALFTRTRSFGNVQNTGSSSSSNGGNKGFRGKVSWSGGFPDEPPLLEELGVDFSQIARRAKSAMNPLPSRKATRETSKDDDLAGPLIVFGMIATLHALQGKLHYGYILGWSAIASGLTCWLLNQLTAQSNNDAGENLSLSRTASVIGYNATSILFLSVVKAFVHSEGSSNSGSKSSNGGSLSGTTNSFGILAFAVVCVLQASSKSSGLFLHGMGQCSEGKRLVVFYPMVLLYSLYALLTLY
jgi:hypothetical protein